MLDLTTEEKKVILFICTISLIGMGIHFFLKTFTPVKSMAILNQNMGKININRSDKDALILIPGIGPTLAQRIIDYRMQNGDFSDIEELRNIKGITESRYEKMKRLVFIE